MQRVRPASTLSRRTPAVNRTKRTAQSDRGCSLDLDSDAPARLRNILTPYCGAAGQVNSNHSVLLHCVTQPSLSVTVQEVVGSDLTHHLMESSPWSSFVQVFCLIYRRIRPCCGLQAALRSAVYTGTPTSQCNMTLPRWEEGVVCRGNQQQQFRELSRWWQSRVGQQVVVTRLSVFRVWTLGRTSDIRPWPEPKIFFISLQKCFPQDYRIIFSRHVQSCLLSIYGTDSPHISLLDHAVILVNKCVRHIQNA